MEFPVYPSGFYTLNSIFQLAFYAYGIYKIAHDIDFIPWSHE